MIPNYKITVFTPTYNRAHTLPQLYNSLLRQNCPEDFEWLIIDDCSTDNTTSIVNQWKKEKKIYINYKKLERNGGKPRAINLAIQLARSPYLFIVDSDDYLSSNTISKILSATKDIHNIPKINGIGVLRCLPDGSCFATPKFKDFIDATNLQRGEIGLDVDCNEAYKISILKNYPFEVWEGENFTPEATVLNAMALDGYKIRWLNVKGVVSEYQNDGLTKNSWNLQKKNPMGFAILFNSNLLHQKGLATRFRTSVLMSTQCFLGKNIKYLLKSNAPTLTILSIPFAVVLYLRRLWQYHSAL